MTSYLLVFAIAFLGSAVQTVVGFGLIIFMMALMPLFLPVGTCLVAAQFAAVFMSAVLIRGKTACLDPGRVVWPALAASAMGIIGLLCLKSIESAVYMKLLGIVLVLLALWMLKFSSLVKIRATPLSGAVAGGLGGLMGALFGVSAPPMVLYFSSISDSKDSYVANLQMTLVIQTGVCILGRLALHMWPSGAMVYCVPALLGALLGKIPGKLLYDRLELKTFKLLVYIFMGLLGLYIFFSN